MLLAFLEVGFHDGASRLSPILRTREVNVTSSATAFRVPNAHTTHHPRKSTGATALPINVVPSVLVSRRGDGRPFHRNPVLIKPPLVPLGRLGQLRITPTAMRALGATRTAIFMGADAVPISVEVRGIVSVHVHWNLWPIQHRPLDPQEG